MMPPFEGSLISGSKPMSVPMKVLMIRPPGSSSTSDPLPVTMAMSSSDTASAALSDGEEERGFRNERAAEKRA